MSSLTIRNSIITMYSSIYIIIMRCWVRAKHGNKSFIRFTLANENQIHYEDKERKFFILSDQKIKSCGKKLIR